MTQTVQISVADFPSDDRKSKTCPEPLGQDRRSSRSKARRLEPSDSDNVKAFFLCGIAQPPIQSDKREALGRFLGGKKGSSEL
jgi:hypothetical protein